MSAGLVGGRPAVAMPVGRPVRTTEDPAEVWYYDGRTFDPLTGRVDDTVRVEFARNGRAGRVTFR